MIMKTMLPGNSSKQIDSHRVAMAAEFCLRGRFLLAHCMVEFRAHRLPIKNWLTSKTYPDSGAWTSRELRLPMLGLGHLKALPHLRLLGLAIHR